MIENIRDRFTAGIQPLYDYLESFREFKDVLQLNPDEFTRNIEMMENPWEVEQMQDEIFKVTNLFHHTHTLIPILSTRVTQLITYMNLKNE